MPTYKPSHERISLNNKLINTQQATKIINELEDAIEAAEFHQQLPEDVNFNARAIITLQNEYDDDDTYPLHIDVSVKDGGHIPTEHFDDPTEDEYGDLYNVSGLVAANNIQTLYDETDELVMFHISMP